MNFVLLFVFIYLVALILVSFWNKIRSSEDFILAERNLGSWTAANSMSASAIGGGVILVAGGFIYQFGISGLWFFIGKIIGYILLTYFIIKIQKRITQKKYCTLADYFLNFHGKKISKFISAILIFFITGVALIGFSGGAQIITFLSGWSYELSFFLLLHVLL